MKKLLLLVLSIVIFSILSSATELKKGDKLQILFYKVWAYADPDDITTHIGPYSYMDDKVTFIEKSRKFPGYMFVVLPDGKEAFIKERLIADNVQISQQQIKDEIKQGKRFKSQYASFNIELTAGLEGWQVLLVAVLFLFVLYKFWKNFYKVDRWFLRRSNNSIDKTQKGWFITLAAIWGGIMGACLTLFKQDETEWFLYEGIRIWANYNSFWHWLLWGTSLLFILTFFAAIIHPFFRLKSNYAIVYSTLSIVSILIYFIAGLITGGFVAIAMILILIVMTAGSNQSSGGGSSSSSSGSNSVYDPSMSQRWNELDRFKS